MKDEMRQTLETNILPFWLQHMRDPERGGWFGQMTGRYVLQPDALRGAILYARLLWSFSAAYRALKKDEYLKAATMTRHYILRHFIDPEYGGTYWSVTADGAPLDTKKQFYAIGFMVYAFSEYARATGDVHALATALQLFDVIEAHGWDPHYGGYIEACTRQWQQLADMRLSDKDQNTPKSQNTHLHIIEPYTNLLRALQHVSPTLSLCSHAAAAAATARPAVETALRRLIHLFITRLINPQTHHLHLFLDLDWTPLSTAESYGHDIECSWLLHEAALVLGDADVLAQVEPVVRQVARASEKGLLPNGAMMHESGDPELHWWVQAEAVVGFVNLYQHFGDAQALEKARRVWHFIRSHLIDRQHGEWFWSIRPDGTVNLDDDHAGFWKCPYHNSRMCLEVIERLSSHCSRRS